MLPPLLLGILALFATPAGAVDYPNDLAAVPPMGWNSWNCYGRDITDERIRTQAEAMVSSGLRDAGFLYLVIDDGWQGERGGVRDALQGAEAFPDMPGLSAWVRGLGLRLGIYSTPWERSYQGRPGSLDHEQEDASQWAAWNISYLKYDWNPVDVAAATRMRDALAVQERGLVYSLSNGVETSLGPTWGELSNLWRTTRDITDTWESMATIGFGQAGLEAYAGPGNWNDPDMMVIGEVGWGADQHPTRLTWDEQVTHVTLWVLLASPLMLGCDLTRLDDDTLSLLTNPDVLDVNQDPAGVQASRAWSEGSAEIWARPLTSGALAVGLFNRGETPLDITAPWSLLRLGGTQDVADLWSGERWEDVPEGVTLTVPPHGARLLRVGAAAQVAPVPVGPLEEGATVGEPFGYTFLSTGTRPFTWEVPDLPPGLTLEGAVITGTPTEAGTFDVPVTVMNGAGETHDTFRLVIRPAPVDGDTSLLLFHPGTLSLPPGESTSLRWSTENATRVTVEPGIGEVAATGTVEVSPSTTTTYTLTVEGQGGPLTRTVTVEVPEGPVLLGLTCPGRLLPTNDPAAWQGWSEAEEDVSILDRALSVGGERALHGIGTHSASRLVYDLGGRYAAFSARAGLDDDVSGTRGSAVFSVVLDGAIAWQSDVRTPTDPALDVYLDVTGVSTLELVVEDGGDTIDDDHADWLEPQLWPGASDDSASPPDTGTPPDTSGPADTGEEGGKGCGCGVASPAKGLLAVPGLVALAGLRRRRRAGIHQPAPSADQRTAK